MDPAEGRYLEDEDTSIIKTPRVTWGTIVATWYDVPRLTLPRLVRTLRIVGNRGLAFAAVGGVYIGVEQLMQHYRMKRDFVNGADELLVLLLLGLPSLVLKVLLLPFSGMVFWCNLLTSSAHYLTFCQGRVSHLLFLLEQHMPLVLQSLMLEFR